jgi:hypothetical protein
MVWFQDGEGGFRVKVTTGTRCGGQTATSEAAFTRPINCYRANRRCLARPTPQEITVRKTILSVLGATILAASLTQTAAAAERHRSTRVDRAPRNADDQAAGLSPAQANVEYWRARGLSSGGPSALRY